MNDPQPVQAGAELTLREALIACGRNAGAFLADGVSDEFLKLVPDEVQGRVQALTDELTRLRDHIREQITFAETRIQDGYVISASVWRIALEDIARENRQALADQPK